MKKLLLAIVLLGTTLTTFAQKDMTAEERYLALHQQDGQLFNQVPLHYLASMLGMTPETLSRIRFKRTS